MTKLFTRYGAEHTGPFCTTAKGAAFVTRPRPCGRCGGAGRSDKWAYTGFTCYDCGGERFRGTETVKLYTAEKLAKLNAAQEKAQAKRQAKAEAKAQAEAAAAAARAGAFRALYAGLIERSAPHMANAFIADVMNRALARNEITDNQAAAVMAAIDRIEHQAAQRAASQHVGKAGERLALKVTVERVLSFQRPAFNAPWTTETVWIVTMRDESGNAIVSKGRFSAQEGESFAIKATVKEHSEYRGEKQTVVQRIKEAA